MARADGKIVFEIMADDDKFKRKLGGLRGEVKGGVSAMAVAVGNLISDMVEKGASAAADLVKSTVGAYAQYEQMVGGVDKLFGSASGKLQQYAANAYKTSGLSANQYMEQATSFSASMISSLGGNVSKAADMTDLAMRSMADNVNVFGSNMTDVQNAFQGFAKQNYTMLDNLKLGYGGTKEEMQRLIRDAAGMTSEQKKLGVTVDANSMSFSNITAAIAVMQEHMGIAGTTTKEAAGTIEGSVGMMKASWENFLTALGSGEGISEVTSQLLESVGYVVQNVGKRLLQIGDSVVRAMPQVSAQVSQAFANMWNTAMGTMQGRLGFRLPTVDGSALAASLQSVGDHVSDFVANVAAALGGSVDDGAVSRLRDDFDGLMPVVSEVADFASGPLATAIGTVLGAAIDVVSGLVTGLMETFGNLTSAFSSSFDGSDEVAAGLQGLGDVLKWLWQNVMVPVGDFLAGPFATAFGTVAGLLGSEIVKAVKAVGRGFTEVFVNGGVGEKVDAAGQAFSSLAEALAPVGEAAVWLWQNALAPLLDFLVGVLSEGVGQFASVALAALADAVKVTADRFTDFVNIAKGVFSAVSSVVKGIVGGVGGLVKFISGVPGKITGFFKGVGSFFSGLWNGVRSVATSVWNGLVSFIGGIPGRVVGFFAGVAGFFSGLWGGVSSTAASIWNGLVSFVGGIPGRIIGFFASLPGRFSSVFGSVGGAISGAFNGAVSAVASVPGRIVGFFRGIGGSIAGAVSGVTSALSRPFTAAWSAISGIPGRIRSAFNGLHISIPTFKLPHVSVTWKGSPIKLPHFSVDWHALGAVIDGPMLFSDAMGGVHGMGERGGEAMIQPLEGAIGRGWADFVAQRVVARQGGDAVVAWLDRNLRDAISESAPVATPREFNRMVRGAMA